MLWKVRWQVFAEPWRLKLGEYLTISVPKGGAGALIYYQGYSEPETANLILKLLRSGMVFILARRVSLCRMHARLAASLPKNRKANP